MTVKLIHCPECYSENLDNSIYCCQCGSPMRKGIPARIRSRGYWVSIGIIILTLGAIIISGMYLFTSPQGHRSSVTEQSQVAQTEILGKGQKIETISQPQRNNNQTLAGKSHKVAKPTAETEQLVVGIVSIINSEGFTVSEFPAPVINGSWLALPTRACVGGNKWFFKVGNNDKAIPIEGGLWGRGDAVGLWQLGGESKFAGPEFATWEQKLPVRLLSIETGLLSEPLTLNPSGVDGAFIYSSLPESLEPGVFFQNDKVVGWSFGNLLNGAYMWPLGNDADLLYDNYVDDFYNETFAGGREEYFSIAFSEGSKLSPQRQLQMFAEGFWVRPKLLPKDTPEYISPERVYPYISTLVKYIMDQGAYQYIVPLAEEPMLAEVLDPVLLMYVTLAIQKIYGTEAALTFIEGTGAEIQRAIEGDKVALTELHLELYLGWITNLLDNGETTRAWQLHNRARSLFVESPRLQLLAIELAIADGDWAEAESLLGQREYPAEFRETLMLLEERISDLKGQQNKIVIRFQAGSNDLPVKATLNDQLEHNFLIDTGATFVTIPYSTVKSLGLDDQMSQHQLEIQTAGGPVFASAVTLSSITLNDWVESDVQALVMELPNRPGLGLLGLNFLNRFRMDLQADNGILTLAPK